MKDYEFLGYREFFRESEERSEEGKVTHWVALDFRVLVDPLKVSNKEPHKFEEVALFHIDNLPEPLHSQSPVWMNKYKDRLV